jgi:superfamily I DNA/RNA helicase
MAVVIYAPHKDGHHDGSIAKHTHAFIRKLFEDDTLPGLHIEPIKSAADPKVRTGRVTDMYRAVLFKVQATGGHPHYIFTGVWPHDEAIKIASRSVLKTNPVNGLPELIMASEVPLPAPLSAVGQHKDPPVEAPRAPLLAAMSAGISLERLTDDLGIDPELAARAMLASSDDDVMALAESAVEWQGLALLDLAAGQTVEQVRSTLALDEHPDVDTGGDDDKLLAGLKTPVARMQFAWLEDDEELRQVVEGGDFAKWRTFLHPEQRKYAETSYRGSFRLSGGAGTGKTVVLLHRARMLARREPAARVVLTTFTRNLADSLQRDLRLLDGSLELAASLGESGVFVTGVDAAASRVLAAASPEARSAAVETVLGVGGNRATRRTADAHAAWRDAIASVGAALPADLRSSAFFAAEYASVVLPNRVTTRDAYLRVRRPGRGVALGRNQRGVVWDVIRAYRSAAAVQGTVDFGEVCAIAAELGNAVPVCLAEHVLVDEGQDLTPAQWQFLRSLVAEGPDDLFIADDSQQRIYGQRVVLGRYYIRIVGRSRRLSLNYRTTEQVLRFASSVLAGTEYVDLDDEVTDDTGYRSARRGPPPTTVAVASLADELEAAAAHVRAWLQDGVQPDAIGILARDQRTVDVVARGFEDHGVSVRQVTRSAATAKHPQLMTMHRAKGMEFSRVLIFGVDAELVPAAYLLKNVPEGERPDLLQRERSLFYVAATRARDELVVMWEGDGSEFLRSSALPATRSAAT